MKNLELQNVEISASFTFSDIEEGIVIKGSCTVDNQKRKVKTLNGTVSEGDATIGTVAAHFDNGHVYNVVQPYDMEDCIRIATSCKDLYKAVEQHDYSQSEDAQEGVEG